MIKRIDKFYIFNGLYFLLFLIAAVLLFVMAYFTLADIQTGDNAGLNYLRLVLCVISAVVLIVFAIKTVIGTYKIYQHDRIQH
jgi:heme/copper-type cytochrome/quinol oxidase subunit 2